MKQQESIRPGKGHPFGIELVKAMHADHMAGMKLVDVAVKHLGHRRGHTVRNAFRSRGLEHRKDPLCGRFQPAPQLTDEEILDALYNNPRKNMGVPFPLRDQWRDWDLAKRTWVVEHMKKTCGWQDPRPQGEYVNCTPYVFGTPEAHAICKRMNQGRTSRESLCQIRSNAAGVIYDGLLWHYNDTTGGYERTRFIKGKAREVLHRTIWAKANGMKQSDLSPNDVIIHINGNKNDMRPENLRRIHREQLLRTTQAKVLRRRGAAVVDALIKRRKTA